MAQVISTLDNAIEYLNFLYEGDSTPPTSGEEDYDVWKGLINVAVDLWENEEGIFWNELFVKLDDAATGDKTIDSSDFSYAVPTDFRYPASGYVWLGSGDNKTPFKVIKQKDLQLYENDTGNWCYFLLDGSPTLEFNPNANLPDGYTIRYNYYKKADKLTTGSDTFDMSDPMFAVYYALSELKKEEGDTSALTIAEQKLESMKTRNMNVSDWQEDTLIPKIGGGMGV